MARDRVEKAKVYFDAVALYPEDDVEAAVDAILSGSAPGVNPNFAPPAPVVASECRRQMNLRLRRMELERFNRPALPPPDKAPATPEQRERAMALVRDFVAKVEANNLTEDAGAARRRAEHWQRTNERFYPDMDPEAVAERLLKRPRFESADSDPDGDWGGQAA